MRCASLASLDFALQSVKLPRERVDLAGEFLLLLEKSEEYVVSGEINSPHLQLTR